MARPKSRTPKLRYHVSGQAIVTIAGRDYYLGKHDSPESLARYAVLIATYQAGGLSLPDDFELASLDERVGAMVGTSPVVAATQQAKQVILVRHLTAFFRAFATKRYVNSPQEVYRSRTLCDEIDQHYGDCPVDEFGPKRLQEQRQRWIDKGHSRAYVNRLTRATVRIFKRGVSEELVEESTWTRLRSVESLRMGESEAKELNKVQPVDLAIVRATAQHLSPIIKSMIRIQVATGARPSEICNMRPVDIDRTGETWIYRPSSHKTKHRGKSKSIPIVGDARDALIDYLQRDPESFCFSPAESMAWFRSQQRSKRKSKVQPSQRDRSTKKKLKQPGERFTPGSYRQSIQRAAKRAGVASWFPYQIRHRTLTDVRDALGAEATAALAGHSHVQMTEHYATQTERAAIEAAKAAPQL